MCDVLGTVRVADNTHSATETESTWLARTGLSLRNAPAV